MTLWYISVIYHNIFYKSIITEKCLFSSFSDLITLFHVHSYTLVDEKIDLFIHLFILGLSTHVQHKTNT